MTKVNKEVKEVADLDLNDFLFSNDVFEPAPEGEAKPKSEIVPKSEEEEEEDEVVEETPEEKQAKELAAKELEEKAKSKKPENIETDELPTFKPLMGKLFEDLGITWDDKLMEQDDLEGVVNVLKKVVEANSVPEFASDETEKFDKYVRDGGNPRKFWDTVYGAADYEKLNLKDSAEDRQKAIKDYYKSTTKFSDEKIAKEIKRLVDLGEDQAEAEDAQKYLVAEQKRQSEKLATELEAQNKAANLGKQEAIDAEKAAIQASKEIAGWEVTDKDKKAFEAYLFEPNKSGLTKYQEFLNANKDWHRRAAWLAFKGMDRKKIDAIQTTEATKKIEDSLRKAQASTLKVTNRVIKKEENPDNSPDFSDFVMN